MCRNMLAVLRALSPDCNLGYVHIMLIVFSFLSMHNKTLNGEKGDITVHQKKVNHFECPSTC